MDAVDPLWTDTAQTAILGAQLLVFAAAAWVATRQVREARRLREHQSRPFVVIDFEVESVLFFLTISNIGTTLARNVRFQIDPPLSSSIDNPVGELKVFREGIPTLAPGKVIRTLFDSGLQRKPEELPDTYRVVARYSDQDERRTFEEAMDLDLGIYWNLSTVDRKGVHDIHKRMVEIRNLLKKWTSQNGALRAVSIDEDRAESERRLKAKEERRRSREDEDDEDAEDPES